MFDNSSKKLQFISKIVFILGSIGSVLMTALGYVYCLRNGMGSTLEVLLLLILAFVPVIGVFAFYSIALIMHGIGELLDRKSIQSNNQR